MEPLFQRENAASVVRNVPIRVLADAPALDTAPTGSTGPTESMGQARLTGPTRLIGLTQSTGPTGSAGPTGSKVSTGSVGTTGLTEPTGTMGSTGQIGPAGSLGLTDPTRTIGQTGSTNQTGSAGQMGPSPSRFNAPGIFQDTADSNNSNTPKNSNYGNLQGANRMPAKFARSTENLVPILNSAGAARKNSPRVTFSCDLPENCAEFEAKNADEKCESDSHAINYRSVPIVKEFMSAAYTRQRTPDAENTATGYSNPNAGELQKLSGGRQAPHTPTVTPMSAATATLAKSAPPGVYDARAVRSVNSTPTPWNGSAAGAGEAGSLGAGAVATARAYRIAGCADAAGAAGAVGKLGSLRAGHSTPSLFHATTTRLASNSNASADVDRPANNQFATKPTGSPVSTRPHEERSASPTLFLGSEKSNGTVYPLFLRRTQTAHTISPANLPPKSCGAVEAPPAGVVHFSMPCAAALNAALRGGAVQESSSSTNASGALADASKTSATSSASLTSLNAPADSASIGGGHQGPGGHQGLIGRRQNPVELQGPLGGRQRPFGGYQRPPENSGPSIPAKLPSLTNLRFGFNRDSTKDKIVGGVNGRVAPGAGGAPTGGTASAKVRLKKASFVPPCIRPQVHEDEDDNQEKDRNERQEAGENRHAPHVKRQSERATQRAEPLLQFRSHSTGSKREDCTDSGQRQSQTESTAGRALFSKGSSSLSRLADDPVEEAIRSLETFDPNDYISNVGKYRDTAQRTALTADEKSTPRSRVAAATSSSASTPSTSSCTSSSGIVADALPGSQRVSTISSSSFSSAADESASSPSGISSSSAAESSGFSTPSQAGHIFSRFHTRSVPPGESQRGPADFVNPNEARGGGFGLRLKSLGAASSAELQLPAAEPPTRVQAYFSANFFEKHAPHVQQQQLRTSSLLLNSANSAASSGSATPTFARSCDALSGAAMGGNASSSTQTATPAVFTGGALVTQAHGILGNSADDSPTHWNETRFSATIPSGSYGSDEANASHYDNVYGMRLTPTAPLDVYRNVVSSWQDEAAYASGYEDGRRAAVVVTTGGAAASADAEAHLRKRFLCTQLTDCAKVIEINAHKMQQYAGGEQQSARWTHDAAHAWRQPHILHHNLPAIRDTVYTIEFALDELVNALARLLIDVQDPKHEEFQRLVAPLHISQALIRQLRANLDATGWALSALARNVPAGSTAGHDALDQFITILNQLPRDCYKLVQWVYQLDVWNAASCTATFMAAPNSSSAPPPLAQNAPMETQFYDSAAGSDVSPSYSSRAWFVAPQTRAQYYTDQTYHPSESYASRSTTPYRHYYDNLREISATPKAGDAVEEQGLKLRTTNRTNGEFVYGGSENSQRGMGRNGGRGGIVLVDTAAIIGGMAAMDTMDGGESTTSSSSAATEEEPIGQAQQAPPHRQLAQLEQQAQQRERQDQRRGQSAHSLSPQEIAPQKQLKDQIVQAQKYAHSPSQLDRFTAPAQSSLIEWFSRAKDSSSTIVDPSGSSTKPSQFTEESFFGPSRKGPEDSALKSAGKDPKDQKDFMDLKDPKKLTDLKDLNDPKELKDPKDLKDLRDLKNLKGPNNLNDPKEPKDLKDPLVSSRQAKIEPNDQPSTVYEEDDLMSVVSESVDSLYGDYSTGARSPLVSPTRQSHKSFWAPNSTDSSRKMAADGRNSAGSGGSEPAAALARRVGEEARELMKFHAPQVVEQTRELCRLIEEFFNVVEERQNAKAFVQKIQMICIRAQTLACIARVVARDDATQRRPLRAHLDAEAARLDALLDECAANARVARENSESVPAVQAMVSSVVGVSQIALSLQQFWTACCGGV